jgi:hypothetical protein
MATKEQIRNIKQNIERTTQGLFTKLQEFRYVETGGFVKPNTLYSIYNTLDKDEKYLTGLKDSTNSKLIFKVKDKSSFLRYRELKFPSRENYPVETRPEITDSDYRIGSITRYFTQQTNDPTKPPFEITQDDFENQNSLYKYTSFSWKLEGTRQEVIRDNQNTINDLIVNYPNIDKSLFPLQFYRAPQNSPDDLEKKLSLLKKT